jgi:plastocyanin
MRHQLLAAMSVGTLVLAACGGNKDEGATTTSDTASTATTTDTATTPRSTATAAPITGKTHEIKMVMDSKGYRFDPANLTIKVGDGVKFVAVSGNPHDVAFDPNGIPAGAKDQLQANMSLSHGELTSPMLMGPDQPLTVSFANLPPGKYAITCPVHIAMNMKGEITVQ